VIGDAIFKNEKEMPEMPVTIGKMSVYTTAHWRNIAPVINREKCSGCMICWKFCPDVCIRIVEESPVIDYNYCKGCGICAVECPLDAIEMVVEDK
jgi:2-oxoacid:acceptor oxidoreductase delta subunit (pyruvate/2-ketoisovalerate family)